eukprot:GEMP01094824.1.p1 GENE.GEMP01094824.1~~GEMP01094824.1.p1  ORF type:complete len:116 (+),score=6.02 GEMP01094824.1:50-349(+)
MLGALRRMQVVIGRSSARSFGDFAGTTGNYKGLPQPISPIKIITAQSYIVPTVIFTTACMLTYFPFWTIPFCRYEHVLTKEADVKYGPPRYGKAKNYWF